MAFKDADAIMQFIYRSSSTTLGWKFNDDNFAVADTTDKSKLFILSLGGGTTAKTTTLISSPTADRSITLPNSTTTLAGLGLAQTFLFKQTFEPTNSGTTPVVFRRSGATGANFWEAVDIDTGIPMAYLDVYGGMGIISLTFDPASSFPLTIDSVTRTYLRVATFPDNSGLVVTCGMESDPPPANYTGRVNRTAQVAAVASTKLTDTTVAGFYRVSYYLETTTADVTAGTIQFNIAYTDDIGATTQSGAALILTATGRDRGVFQVYLASGNITYSTTLVGVIGTSQYALRVRCEFLG